MPITVCSISSCFSKGIKMFNFPRDVNMQSMWLSYLAPHCPKLLQLTSEQLIYKKICIKHFETQYLNGFKRKYYGFPTLFTEEEISTGIPNKPYITIYSGDHTYCKISLENVKESVSEIAKQPKYSEEHLPGTKLSARNETQENFDNTEETEGQYSHKRKHDSNISQHLHSNSSDNCENVDNNNCQNNENATVATNKSVMNTSVIQFVMNELPNSDNFSCDTVGVMNGDVLSPMSESEEHFNADVTPLPEFDPNNKQLRIDDWIDKVEEYAALHQWSEEKLLKNALSKLIGLAKIWYDSVRSLNYSWTKCKNELYKQFPAYDNYAQILREMLETKAALKESLELYYHDKIKLLKRCDITGKRAVDCLLDGIEDKNLLYRAQVACYTEPEQLLPFFKSVKVKDPNFQCNSIEEVILEDSDAPNYPSQLNLPESLSDECIIPVVVNMQPMSCCVDFNNHNTLIRVTDFIELDVPCSTNDLPLLYGLDDLLIQPLGKVVVDIQVQTVKTSLEVFIVPDEVLNYPILLGRNFIEQAGVLMVQADERLWTGS